MTATAAERYQHVVQVWMRASSFITRALSLSGVSTYHDLVRLLDNPDEINALRNRNPEYLDEDGDPVPGQSEWRTIHAGVADRFRYCRSFINVLQLKHGPVIDAGLVDFTTMDVDDFENFLAARGPFVEYSEDRAIVLLHLREDRVESIRNRAGTSTTTSGIGTSSGFGTGNATPNVTQGFASSTSPEKTQLRSLEKTLKMDVSSFPTLSKDVAWIQFYRELKAACTLFKMQDVLDPLYLPVVGDAAELFAVQNQFMMTVLSTNIKTTKGKEIVNRFLSVCNAQEAIKELVEHYTGDGSMQRRSTSDSLMNLINAPIPANYSGAMLFDLLTRWEAWVYEWGVIEGTPVSSVEKLKLLERYVANVDGFRNVVSNSLMLAAVSTNAMSADTKIVLYRTQASVLDNAQKNFARRRRSALVHELMTIRQIREAHASEGYQQLDLDYMLDPSLDEARWLEVYMSSQRASMNKRAWDSLTKTEQQLWDQFSNESKHIILNCRLESSQQPQPGRKPFQQGRKPFQQQQGRKPRAPFRPSHNPNSAERSGTTPVANTARVNVTEIVEQDETTSPHEDQGGEDFSNVFMNQLVANVHERPSSWLDGELIDARNVREINQTSHHPTFAMGRFLSEEQSEASLEPMAAFPGEYEDVEHETVSEAVVEHETAVEVNLIDLSDVDARVEDMRIASQLEADFGDIVYSAFTHSINRPDITRRVICQSLRNSHQPAGMFDRGANGGVAGDLSSVRVVDTIPNVFIDIQGIDNHTLRRVPIGTVGCVVATQRGDVILIMHQYALLGSGRTIHSSIQFEDWNNTVSDTGIAFGGQQRIVTPDGYAIPLDIANGLVFMNSRAFTDDEWNDLPHVVMTRDAPWNPRVHDHEASESDAWRENQDDAPLPNGADFNAFGDFNHRTTATEVMTTAVIPSTNRPPNFNNYYYPRQRVTTVAVTDASHLATSQPITIYHDDYRIIIRDVNFTSAINREMNYLLTQTSTFGNLLNGTVASVHDVRQRPADYESYRRFFLNAPREVVQRTFRATTQHYRSIPATNRILDTRRTHYPAVNRPRRHEGVGTDTLFFDIPAWGGFRCVQVYVGRSSYYLSVHGMNTDGEFINTFEDEIRQRGAMDTIISDRAQAEVSNRVKTILRNLYIKDWQSEPHHQNQNISERFIQELKKYANWIRNTSGAPPQAIFLILKYVCFIFNRTARKNLSWRTPCEALNGQTPDVSMMLHFRFWQRVYIKDYRKLGTGFPSRANEILCHFVGFAETVGHSMTFLVWNPATKKLLHRSSLRAATDDDKNHPGNPPDDDDDSDGPDDGDDGVNEELNDGHDDGDNEDSEPETAPEPRDDQEGGRPSGPQDTVRQHTSPSGASLLAFQLKPEDIVGRHVLQKEAADGTRTRAKILELVEEFEGQRDSQPERVKFKARIGTSKFDKLIDYSDMCELIEEQTMDENGDWVFLEIVGHTTPKTRQGKPKLLVKWESGEITLEPTMNFHNTCSYKWIIAEYARDNGLVDEWDEYWPSMHIKKNARNTKKILRQINAAKIVSYKNSPVYMYGHQVPRNHQQALEIDRANGNTMWQQSEKMERDQLKEYNTFIDKGPNPNARELAGYKKINLHFVYAVKHDGRYKSRIVAGGHLTDTPVESVYSGVVSLRGVRFCIFLAELNELQVWQTDVGNAYLEAFTKEKVYVIAGPEFAEIQGHVLIISRALYGLKSSGLRWYERFADVLRGMGFDPCPAEPEIWMRACASDGSVLKQQLPKPNSVNTKRSFFEPPDRAKDGSYYEYIAVYCDDLTIASRDPKAITDALQKKYLFKLKGTGPLKFLLGCDYFREGKTLCAAPRKYIEKMDATYLKFFGEKPNQKYRSPLAKGDNPELDTSEFLDETNTKIYQSMIGAAQWVISLTRFDIAVHVMTLSSFRVQPRQGHLDRIKRVYGYLSKMKHGTIRFRTEMPDTSDFDFLVQDWSNSPYADTREEFPKNLPLARGKPVLMTTFVDANLMHDVLSGKSVTGVLHFFNKTPIDWYSKKQNTVETATYGSENNAARAAIEQIKAIKLTLMWLGVPLHGSPILLGDNESVTISGTQPDNKLHKRHLMLSYHYVRENVAAGCIRFAFIRGEYNPADTLSKHWAYQAVWPLIQPILFWKGDTSNIAKLKEEKGNKKKKKEDEESDD